MVQEPQRTSANGCLLNGALILLGELVILIILMVVSVVTIGRFLAVDDDLDRADAIVVLGGNCGEYPRVRHALQLYQGGYAPTVVMSGGTMAGTGIACSSAQISLEAAQSLGLPADAAIVADGAQTTYDEAVNIRRLTQQHGWQSLIIVTSPLHTRRAARTFRTLLPETTIYVSLAPYADRDAGPWWQDEDDLVAVVNEVLKLGFYWVKYGVAPVG